MNIMARKSSVLLLGLIGVLSFVLWRYFEAALPAASINSEMHSNTPDISAESLQSRIFEIASVKESLAATGSKKEHIPADAYGKFSGTKSQNDEINAWRLERGYMPYDADKGSNAYNSYTDESLRVMVKNGDMMAMHALADRYQDLNHMKKNGIDILTAESIRSDLFYQAAIYGSTNALYELGLEQDAKNPRSDPSGAERRAGQVELMAWYKVAALRGDLDPLKRELMVVESVKGVVLTDAEWRLIDERANKIYSDLQRQRKDLGLGEFDNSVPEVVKNWYEARDIKNFK